MPSNLERVASRLLCPRCRSTNWLVGEHSATGRASLARSVAQRLGLGRRGDGLTCQACGARYPCEGGVLLLTGDFDDPAIARERDAVLAIERDPTLGGANVSFDQVSNAEGPLADALLSLPWGNGSRHYEEPGYFWNVRSSARGFDFVLQNLRLAAGERLLDLGADMTWSTAHFARRGAACTAVDINHHLPLAHLFQETYGVSYDLVQADMTTVPFADGSFDVVVGIDALHHSNHLDALARNIARMLTPGGRLGLVEPYCQTEADKEAFGREQIRAGISEHVHLLDEWHRAFAAAGLVARTHRVAESFAAVYEKPREASSPPPESRAALADLFDGFYDARLTVLLDPASRVRPGEVFHVPVRVENRGRHTWCTNSHFLVRLTYHLYRAGLDLVTWDNPRTALPCEVAPGDAVTVRLEVTAPRESGDYVAEIDMLQEYISWFAEKGTEPRRVRFSVV